MATWSEFAAAAPELATWGEKLFNRSRVAFLATVQKDGDPCVHPVTPIICQGHLGLFVDPDSPNAYDLRRDGRYALHSLVDNPSGLGGEFYVTGRATPIESTDMRRKAIESSCYTPAEHHVLFELTVESASATDYAEGGRPHQARWSEARAAV